MMAAAGAGQRPRNPFPRARGDGFSAGALMVTMRPRQLILCTPEPGGVEGRRVLAFLGYVDRPRPAVALREEAAGRTVLLEPEAECQVLPGLWMKALKGRRVAVQHNGGWKVALARRAPAGAGEGTV